MQNQHVEIRPMQEEDFFAGLELLKFCFNFTVDEKYYDKLKTHFNSETRYGAFVDNKLQSQLGILPLTFSYNNIEFSGGGISRVSSYPEARRQGNINRLLATAFNALHQKKNTLALLVPFNVDFYRKYGWEVVSKYVHVSLDIRQLPQYPNEVALSIRAGAPRAEEAVALYNLHAKRQGAYLVRDTAWWEFIVSPRKNHQAATSVNAGGQLTGYLLYTVIDSAPSVNYQDIRGSRQLVIHELVYVDEVTRQQLWRFISSFDSMVDAVDFSVAEDDPILIDLAGKTHLQRRKTHLMGRIIDVAGFINRYQFNASSQDISLTLKITDEHAAWNHHSWRLEINKTGEATIGIIPAPETHDIDIDIGSLTTLLLGYQRVQRLAERGNIIAAENIQRLLASRIAYSASFHPEFF